MVKLTRINLAYVLLGGIFARYLVDSAFFDLESKFTESLAALTSLTSLFSGLLIVLSFHHIFNVWLIRLLGKIRKDDHYRFKIELISKSDFTDTLDNVYGNTLITIILVISSIAYLFPNPLLEIFQIPLVDQGHYLIISFFLSVIVIGMGRNTILSWKNWKNRLNYFAYYEYILSIHELSIPENLQKYRDNISSDWDKVEEEYNQIKKEIIRSLEYLSKTISDFCENYNRQQNELLEYLDIDEPDVWGSNISTPLGSFWKKWYEPPSQIQDIFNYFFKLKNKGTIHFLSPSLRKNFISVLEEYEKGRIILQNFNEYNSTLLKVVSENVSQEQKYIENDLPKILVLWHTFDQEPLVSIILDKLMRKYKKDWGVMTEFNTDNSSTRLGDFQKPVSATEVLGQIIETRKVVRNTCNLLCEDMDYQISIIEDCVKHLKLRSAWIDKFKKRAQKHFES